MAIATQSVGALQLVVTVSRSSPPVPRDATRPQPAAIIATATNISLEFVISILLPLHLRQKSD